MDAQKTFSATTLRKQLPQSILILAFSISLLLPASLHAASVATTNFVVTAPTAEFAQQVAQEAEVFRKQIAMEWLGRQMPTWPEKCPIRCKVGQIGAGGATTFSFHGGKVYGFQMDIQGTEERILDSVLPHEITHTVLAWHFRRPVPRWADEGASTLIEHFSERQIQIDLLEKVMHQNSRIPIRQLLTITEYPADMYEVRKLYAEGYSLVNYLVQQSDEKVFLRFLEVVFQTNNWDEALRQVYDVKNVSALEQHWLEWVTAGSPDLTTPDGILYALHPDQSPAEEMLASTTPANETIRGQSPEAFPEDPAEPKRIFEEMPALPVSPAVTTLKSRDGLVAPVMVEQSPRNETTRREFANPGVKKSRDGLPLTGSTYQPKAQLIDRSQSATPFQSSQQNHRFVP